MKRMLLPPIFVLAALLAFSLWNIRHMEGETNRWREQLQQADAEADALRKEADVYVDGRIAAMEAGLQKTLSQIQTMRARLASRSGLDADA